LKWIIPELPELRVLALTKRHVGSGNEIELQRNGRHFLMRARLLRVKLCAVGMRNAMLGNDLKQPN